MSFKENNQDIDFDKEFPAFLIGNKCDLEHTINDFEIENLKNEHNFYGFADTSAKDGIGIDNVFSEMGSYWTKLKETKKKKTKCENYEYKKEEKKETMHFLNQIVDYYFIL